MSDQKISELTELAQGAIATDDEFAIVDTNATATKRITWSSLRTDIANYIATLFQSILSEGAFVDGDKTKLDGIETGADVTDTANVTSAGALMDSELTDIAAVKALSDADASAVNTGTSTTAFVTPDALAGANIGIRYVQCVVFDFTTDVSTGDGKFYYHIPAGLNGMNLVEVHAEVITAGTTNSTTVQIHNVTQAADMLSALLEIETTETGSDTSDPGPTIDTNNDDVATNDVIRIDVDSVSTTAPKGLIVTMGFQLP